MLWKLLSESLKPARHKTRAEKGVSEYRNEQVKEGLTYLGYFWLIVDVMCRENGKKETRKQNEESRKWKSESGRRKLDRKQISGNTK